MGFFDSLFGKKQVDEDLEADAPGDGAGSAPAGPKTWVQRLAEASEHEDFDWDWSNERARRLVAEYLTELAPHFGGGKVKEVPDDGHIDLRGTFEGSPVRFAIWMSFGSFWAIEMKSSHGLAELYVERDHEKIPKHKDESDPWEADEERRIFVAKGIFFEGDDNEIAEKLDQWEKLPASLRARILAEMERLDCSIVRAYGSDIAVHQRPGLAELHDPLTYMQDCARLMVDIRDHATKAADVAASTPGARIAGLVLGHRVDCAFCSTLFLQTPSSTNCPNCGAPPQG